MRPVDLISRWKHGPIFIEEWRYVLHITLFLNNHVNKWTAFPTLRHEHVSNNGSLCCEILRGKSSVTDDMKDYLFKQLEQKRCLRLFYHVLQIYKLIIIHHPLI